MKATKNTIIHVARVFGMVLLGLVVVLTLAPPRFRPYTAVPHILEHGSIFLLVGLAFAMGYPERVLRVTISLVLFCAILEVAQVFVPGRHARLSDFLVDAAAACVGTVVGRLLARAIRLA